MKTRTYKYKGIDIIVLPGVFHPGYFFSTRLLLDYMDKNIELKSLNFLELGSGTGLISVYAAKKKAIVTSTDISNQAIKNTVKNLTMNKVNSIAILSDLFLNIPIQTFDVIIINPPYFKGIPKQESEYSWYAGRDLNYFQQLFSQLSSYTNNLSKVIMILSDDCDIPCISKLGLNNQYLLKEVYRKRKYWEVNYIFEIVPVSASYK